MEAVDKVEGGEVAVDGVEVEEAVDAVEMDEGVDAVLRVEGADVGELTEEGVQTQQVSAVNLLSGLAEIVAKSKVVQRL